MDLRKCCVGNCSSTNRTHRLFFLPKDDNLRELWLSFLIPTNVELRGLTKKQLLTKRVCQDHFDRYQFDSMGNRLRRGYPCLFSAKEIRYGIPLSSTDGDHLSDHNYALPIATIRDTDSTSAIGTGEVPEPMETQSNEQIMEPKLAETTGHGSDEKLVGSQVPVIKNTETEPMETEVMVSVTYEKVKQKLLVIAETADGDHLSDHNYALPIATIRDTDSTSAIGTGEVPEPMETQSNEQIMEPKLAETTDTMKISKRRCIQYKPIKTTHLKKVDKNIKKKCNSFIKEMKKQALDVKKNSFDERLAEARTLSQARLFLRNFGQLNKHAQNFVMMQLKSVNKKKKGVRFTTDEKLLALTLMKESPKGYRLLQKIFKLPTKRTLNRLAEKITFGVGINENIFRLIEKSTENWNTTKKICSIVFDEVAITPHLTYVESKDEIEGFKDLGNQRYLKFSDHALVFMLRGVCSNWKQSIAYYCCEGTTSAAEVQRILKELVAKVSQSGLIPIALVCDQGTTFRSALKMLRQETERERNLKGEYNDGTIEISGQKLSVVFDPPHLLKGLRNNFLTKNLIFNGAIATWDDILTVYKADCQLGHTRMNKKLKDHHVIASKIKKMKVSVAANVLSERTSAILKYTALFSTTVGGEKVSATMKTTGEAVEFMDKLFDSVNGSKRNTTKGKLRGPIKPNSEHFEFWHEAIKTLKNMKFVDSASKKAITNRKVYHIKVPSLDGWVITLESFERIANLLFNKYELEYFYPRSINQDPIENFFGRIRAMNYRNVNPDTYTFVNAFKSLLISNVMGPHSIYANCEADDAQSIVDFYHLLKEEVGFDDKENVPSGASDIIFPDNHKNVLSGKYPLSSSKETVNTMHATLSLDPPKQSQSSTVDSITAAINERVRVHTSAYTAGYLCRKLTKKFNCKRCQETYIAHEKENIHEWIVHREYKKLNNSNLAYPSKRVLILYRDLSNFIHGYLNKYAHIKSIGKQIKKEIIQKFNLDWLGCTNHKINEYFLKLIIRMHIHNWCHIINKILRGNIDEKYVLKMGDVQITAYNKYKITRLRNKNK